jgi:hypothetical protein
MRADTRQRALITAVILFASARALAGQSAALTAPVQTTLALTREETRK